MTKKELSQLYHLNREIEQQKDELARLELKSKNYILHDTVKGSSAEFPYTQHTIGLYGVVDDVKTRAYSDEIADLKQLIRLNIEKCMIERNRLERYIVTVDDSLVRQILRLRYINGLTWVAVAMHIGGGNTEDGVRKAHDRFLAKN